MVEWIGHPQDKDKNHNFFNGTSNKKIVYPYPSQMFRDADRDGVPNVFDCKPHNSQKQGFIDAVIGGVKGLVGGTGAKAGWREGMAQKGNPVSRAYSQRVQAVRTRDIKERQVVAKGRRQESIRRFATSPQEKVRQMLPGQTSSYDSYKVTEARKKLHEAELDRQAKARGEKVVKLAKEIKANVTSRLPSWTNMRTGHPDFARKTDLEYYRLRAKNEKLTEEQRTKAKAMMDKLNVKSATRLKNFQKRAIGAAFPVQGIVSGDVSGNKKTVAGITSQGRGRPRGTLDKRYAAYGGVFGYRKYVSEQKKKLREQLAAQSQKVSQEQLPQYETQQYTQQTQVQQVAQSQLPQELQGQQITPEYAQFLAEQQAQQEAQQYSQPQQPQYQQYPSQQYPTQPQQRPIATVFKSSGGSPYPAVNSQPRIRPSSETIPYGYVEAVDLMSGRKYIKKLPPSERWAKSGYQYGGYPQ